MTEVSTIAARPTLEQVADIMRYNGVSSPDDRLKRHVLGLAEDQVEHPVAVRTVEDVVTAGYQLLTSACDAVMNTWARRTSCDLAIAATVIRPAQQMVEVPF